jgi:hypothetical protein
MLKFSKVGLLNLMADLKGSDELMLVGDQGVYIMSFAHEHTQEDPRPLVHAEGCDPERDEDAYDNKCILFGEDDGGDHIGTVNSLRSLLNSCVNELHVKLSGNTITLHTDAKVATKEKIDVSALPPELRKYL